MVFPEAKISLDLSKIQRLFSFDYWLSLKFSPCQTNMIVEPFWVPIW
jgi:hypothetical protein